MLCWSTARFARCLLTPYNSEVSSSEMSGLYSVKIDVSRTYSGSKWLLKILGTCGGFIFFRNTASQSMSAHQGCFLILLCVPLVILLFGFLLSIIFSRSASCVEIKFFGYFNSLLSTYLNISF